MGKRLKLNLTTHWEDATHLYENATFTYQCNLSGSTGILQLMIAEYKGGEPPHPSEETLIEFAVGAGTENHGGQLVTTFSGKNALGSFGSAVFRASHESQPQYYQVWFSSNGLDLIYVIFESSAAPSDDELSETQQIIEQLDFR